MGLSVISQLATVISTNSLPTATETGSALPGDFAALLSGQTLAAVMSLGSSTTVDAKAVTDKPLGQESNTGQDRDEDSVALVDPAALIAMLAPPPIQPPVQNQSPIVLNQPPFQNQSKSAVVPDVTLQSREAEGLVLGNTTAALTGDTTSKSKSAPGPTQPLQASYLGTVSTSTTSPTGSAPAEKPVLNTANIAASSDAGSGAPPAFSEALTHSLHQRTANPGQQPLEFSVNAHLHTPAWPRQFSENVVWMSNNNVQSAQININPPQLGPVQITLNLSGDQATAIFASPHAEVRQAIESSMPQLKEMLASAGISLGDTNVGANLAQQNPNSPFLAPNRTQSALENAILPANDNAPGAGVATPLKHGRGLVDLFA